jgi:hypothetical protein
MHVEINNIVYSASRQPTVKVGSILIKKKYKIKKEKYI